MTCGLSDEMQRSIKEQRPAVIIEMGSRGMSAVMDMYVVMTNHVRSSASVHETHLRGVQ